MGQKETIGTGTGALLGGVAGTLIGKGTNGKVAGGVLGALIGGAIGNRIGAMLDEQDQQALQQQARLALINQPDNSKIVWTSPKSDATATVVPQNTHTEARSVTVVSNADITSAPIDYRGSVYQVLKTANVRRAPSGDAGLVTTLPAGSTIWAVGEVHGQPWIMVAEHGKAIGYVSKPLLSQAPTPALQAVGAGPASPSPSASSDIDLPPLRSQQALKTLGPNEKANTVVASVTCREISTTATAKGETATSVQSACQSPDGAWQLN
jgi:surface antigen